MHDDACTAYLIFSSRQIFSLHTQWYMEMRILRIINACVSTRRKKWEWNTFWWKCKCSVKDGDGNDDDAVQFVLPFVVQKNTRIVAMHVFASFILIKPHLNSTVYHDHRRLELSLMCVMCYHDDHGSDLVFMTILLTLSQQVNTIVTREVIWSLRE